MNPLYQMSQKTKAGNLQNQFTQFKQTLNGNPQAIVQNLLSSGKMSQEQFKQLGDQATMLSKFLK